MVALIDADMAQPSEESVGRYALNLLTCEAIRSIRYSNSGPLEGAPKVDNPFRSAIDGWVVFSRLDDGFVVGEVITTDGKTVSAQGVVGRDSLELARARGAHLYGGDADAAEQDALAGMIAEEIGADLFVTERPLLLDASFSHVRGVACVRPNDAVPIIGLYLRLQNRFVVDKGDAFTHKMNRGLFYWVGTRELLPSGWRWMSACVEESQRSGDDAFVWLATSLHQRVERALIARDRVHRWLLMPQDNDTADEALSEFDAVLFNLMGAFDVAALVAHMALGFKGRVRDAAWQLPEWRTQVRRTSPAFAGLLDDDSPGIHVLTVLRLLRNSVHSEALPPLAMSEALGRHDTFVGLPRAQREDIVAALEHLGGLAQWGVKGIITGRHHADIRVLLEQLFPSAILLLDSLLHATPVERLPNVDADALMQEPPNDHVFTEPVRKRIRWQLGL